MQLWKTTKARGSFSPAWTAVGLVLAASLRLGAGDFQGSTHQVAYDGDIGYHQRTPNEAVARLQRKIDRGEVRLRLINLDTFRAPGIARRAEVFPDVSLLENLVAAAPISPANPRAVYFNDDVYVGFIPGAFVGSAPSIESGRDLSAGSGHDGEAAAKAARTCSATERPRLSKSLAARPVVATTTPGSTCITGEQYHAPDPLEDRWAGGFTQSGASGQFGWPGCFRASSEGTELPRQSCGPQCSFDIKKYRSGKRYRSLDGARTSGAHAQLPYPAQLRDPDHAPQYGHIRYLKSQSEAFLRYLLFTDEAPLTAPVRGNQAFVSAFTRLGPRDQKGRSLRDLDLQTRLFKHSCSFLICSPAFDSIPGPMNEHLYQRLWDILMARDPSPDFSKLR